MNKLLLGTTALVAASLLMAGVAEAAKPKAKWGGAIRFTAGGSTQDVDAGGFSGAAGDGSKGPTLGYAFRTSSELKFNASGKTDAGMKWKAEVQLEADTNVSAQSALGGKGDETVIDETWVRFSGSWGQLTLGSQDGVEESYLISSDDAVKSAGTGGVDGNWTDYIDAGEISRMWDEPDDNEDSSDATKIIYVTPRVGGVGVGVSWTPDTGAHGQATDTDLGDDDFLNAVAVAVDFKKKLGGAKVHVAGAVHFGDAEDETLEDLLAWSIGASIGYGNWRVAGNYMDKGDSNEDKTNTFDQDATAWTAGIGYSQGPVHLGVAWLHGEVEIDAPDDDERDVLVVGASYMLGGGAKVLIDVFWLNDDSGESPSGDENEGVGFLVGAEVKW